MYNFKVLLLISSVSAYANVFTYEKRVEELFKEYKVVPDVVQKAPKELAFVLHPSGAEAILGNEVTPTQTRDVPAVAWNAEPDCYYTLAMIDPDVPSRANPTDRELQHWLVGNIHGSQQKGIKGDIITEYIGPVPGPKTDLHRYVFLVYKQPSKIIFNEPRINASTSAGRPGFSIASFAKKYNLGEPTAGNFYRARYDDYVPIARAQAGDYSLLPCLTGEVQYPNATVNLGNQISTLETLLPPNLSYGADPGSYYSMLMFDFNPPIGGIALQWGIGNIEGNATSSGTLLSKYFPPDPVPVPRGFAFLLYQQPGKLQFDLIDNVKTETSIYFDLNGFVQKHNLTGPLNGNFFISIVPVVSPIINEIL